MRWIFCHLNIYSNDGSSSAVLPDAAGGAAAIERAAGMFRALGETSRLRLLVTLAQGEACVSDAAAAAGDEISTVSQRLRVLRAEGLVSRRRQGKRILYGLADRHVADLIFNALEHAMEGRPAPGISRKEERKTHVSHDSHR